jgi:16S rRNA (guanine527-N7)-methyltransferase
MTTLPLLRLEVAKLGITLDDAAYDRLDRYRALLLAANEQFNLTRITAPEDVELRLLADSLALLPLIPAEARSLLDIGSGGGVPGLPLAIARPVLRVVLLDATAKKVRFLEATARELGLENVVAVHGRAEELARDGQHRERYDIVTARAVARLVTLVELALPFLAVGGRALLPKGSAAAEELAEARYATGMLGGVAAAPVDAIAGTRVVVVEKRRPTPAQFPRRTGVPGSSPLFGPDRRAGS